MGSMREWIKARGQPGNHKTSPRKSCLCLQRFATVGNRLRRRRNALRSAECCAGRGFESVSSWPVTPQFFWRLQRRCLCESSVTPQLRDLLYFGVCRGGVSVSHLWRCSYVGLCRGGVSVSDLCRPTYFGVCRSVCVICCILAFAEEVSVWVICVAAVYQTAFPEEVSVWVICVAANYFGVCRGGGGVRDLCRRSYFGVCRGGVSARDLLRRSSSAVCRGGVSVSDLWRAVLWTFAEEVSVWVICGLQECEVRMPYKSVK